MRRVSGCEACAAARSPERAAAAVMVVHVLLSPLLPAVAAGLQDAAAMARGVPAMAAADAGVVVAVVVRAVGGAVGGVQGQIQAACAAGRPRAATDAAPQEFVLSFKRTRSPSCRSGHTGGCVY